MSGGDQVPAEHGVLFWTDLRPVVGSAVKILYLDENPGEAKELDQALAPIRQEGRHTKIEVVSVTDEAAALERLASEPPDLLFVGYSRQDGKATERFVNRIIGKSQHPPVVLVIGLQRLELSQGLLSAVAESHLRILQKQSMDAQAISQLLDDLLGKTYRVLILDDEENEFKAIKMQLGFHTGGHFDCVWAASVRQAHDILAENPSEFDAFIVDYKLSGELGTEFLRELIQAGCSQPIVLATGHSALELDEELLRMVSTGQAKFLSKSNLSTDSLIKRLQIR